MQYTCINIFWIWTYRYWVKIKIGVLESEGNERLDHRTAVCPYGSEGFSGHFELFISASRPLPLLLGDIEAGVRLSTGVCVSVGVAMWSPQPGAQVEFTACFVGFTLPFLACVIWRDYLFSTLISRKVQEQVRAVVLKCCIPSSSQRPAFFLKAVG